MSTLQFLGLPQDGRMWRIEGLAHVLTVPYRITPMVEVIISTKSAAPATEYKVAEMSVAAWSRLIIGRCWKNGTRVQSPGNGQRRVIDLRIEPSGMHLANLRLTKAPVSDAVKAAMEGLLCIAFELGQSDAEVRFIGVPCAELFRAGWCQTAVIPYLMLTGVYLGPSERLFNPQRSFLRDRFAFVHLGLRTPNRAAQLVARIAFDKAAQTATQRIISDMIAARNQEKPRYPLIATPPFSGDSTWEVIGRPVTWGRRRGFLVTQILKWTGPKQFDHVGSYRDNPGGDAAITEDIRRAFAGIVRRQPSGKRELVQISEAGDPNQQDLALKLFDAEEDPVDPPVPQTVYKNPNPQRHGGGRTTIEDGAEKRIFSTGHGAVGSPFANVDLEVWPTDKGDESTPGTLAFFEGTVDLLPDVAKTITEKYGDIVAVDVKHEIVAMSWGTLHRARRIWSRILDTEHGWRPRRVCVAYIRINGEPFTIFEIERRLTEDSQATLGVRGHPTTTELKTMFFICAGNDGQLADPEWAKFELSHFERLHFKHCAKTAERYASYILRKIYLPAIPSDSENMEHESNADSHAATI